ncbi:hypothetical protein WJX72_008865 [[Myrmecia] bisecta]|uniref:Deubiquitinating enzyme MINDY-3/4 conserved domain-containing protein n=1 Tax=[Myrmecia] bisecta TaxID=41462 RepID=A0AAW1Q9I8_9CHLO
MQAGGYDLLLLLFSVVLSHSVRQIQAERDESESALIARHSYCSPDLVHLLLTGRAVANCFNGDRQLDGKVHRGIPARSQLGLLTLFEHYRYVELGSHLKSPHLPIWLVCSESHFTTLFAPSARDGRLASSNAQSTFDQLYYDGLSSQDSTITLPVSQKGHTREPRVVFSPFKAHQGLLFPACTLRQHQRGVALVVPAPDPPCSCGAGCLLEADMQHSRYAALQLANIRTGFTSPTQAQKPRLAAGGASKPAAGQNPKGK